MKSLHGDKITPRYPGMEFITDALLDGSDNLRMCHVLHDRGFAVDEKVLKVW